MVLDKPHDLLVYEIWLIVVHDALGLLDELEAAKSHSRYNPTASTLGNGASEAQTK